MAVKSLICFTVELAMRFLYFLKFMLGSMTVCISVCSFRYLPGTFSQVALSRFTAPCSSPEVMANMAFRFWVSL